MMSSSSMTSLNPPLGAPLLPRRDGDRDMAPQGPVPCRILGSQQVLDEEGPILLDGLAQCDGVGGVQAGVDVKAYLDVETDGLPDHGHPLLGDPDGFHQFKTPVATPRLGSFPGLGLAPAHEFPTLPARATASPRSVVADTRDRACSTSLSLMSFFQPVDPTKFSSSSEPCRGSPR